MIAVLVGFGSVVQAQQMGAGAGGIGAGTIPGTPFGGAIDPSMVQVREGFQVIPSLSIGQRYDSNVFFVPKRPGLDREDMVTTAVPQVRGYYVGNWVDVNASVAAIGEYYAQHPTLNYVGTNTGAVLNLSKLLDRWWQGATWTASDTYLYSPQAPSFLMGNLAGTGATPFATGFQVGRASVSRNVVSTDLALPLTQTVGLIGSYTNGFSRFGTSDVQQSGVLINTQYQTYTAGLSLKASPQDLLSVQAVNSEFDFSTRPPASFSTHGGTVGWDHMVSPVLTIRSQAGATVLQRDLVGASSAALVAPIGQLALLWKDRTTAVTLAYNLGVSPSFQFQAQALQTHVVSVTLTQQTAIPELLAVANVNYGRGDQFGSSPAGLSYTSVAGTGGVVYKFTPETFLGLNYTYANFDNEFNGRTFAFDRHVVQLSLTRAFY